MQIRLNNVRLAFTRLLEPTLMDEPYTRQVSRQHHPSCPECTQYRYRVYNLAAHCRIVVCISPVRDFLLAARG